jgi:cation diffusion facilitator CzcD-associated flavoprotein CzcO
LNAWSWPNITGLQDFQGDLLHSADWKDGYSFAGKRVAVIGNGSSAIQIVPQLQKEAAHLVNYVRTPTYISAPFAEDLCKEPGANPAYTEEEKEEFRRNPAKLRQYRKSLAHSFNQFYSALLEGSEQNREARRRTVQMMKDRLKGRPDLVDKLIPDWSLGCRRLTPGNGYLESLTESNVTVTSNPIAEITETGILTGDGEHQKYDVIVCATGFDVSFKPRWLQVGRNGRSLADDWAEDATSYFSICVSGHPNHFIFNG